MSYLLVLNEALDDNFVDEINAAGAYLPKGLVSSKLYIKGECDGCLGLRLNDKFKFLGYAAMRYYRSDGRYHVAGYTEINLDQSLELLGIKEPEPFENEIMSLLGG